MRLARVFKLSLVVVGLVTFFVAAEFNAPQLEAQRRETLQKTLQAGNFKDAYEGYRELALERTADPAQVGNYLNQAIECLRRLNRVDEIDAFREAVIKQHAENWRLLWTAAQSYMNVEHHGHLIAGEFQRGHHRGGGELVNAQQRDRVRALQLMRQAMPAANLADAPQEQANFYFSLAEILLNHRGHQEGWRLQSLTDLETPPDYEPGWGHHVPVQGAPVNAEGQPVFHNEPESWAAAESDGQRWRFALAEAVRLAPDTLNRARMEQANFLHAQFGVQTMAHFGRFLPRDDKDEQDESGTYALHTLKETETIARLATGVKRFDLPDEFNFIKLYRAVADDEKAGGYGETALTQLAQIFENRRQYPRAAEIWRENIKRFGAAEHKQQRLQQIVGNWGQFEPIMTQPAGQGASVEFRFRNGPQVSFEAHAIKVELLLEDVKAYLKSNPQRLEWERVSIDNLGYRLVHQNQEKYVGERVAQWSVKLDPAKDHFDRRMTIATPLVKPGAYLLTGKMADGNVSKIVVWVADTAIVKKMMAGKAYYFIADAVTGKPVPAANVEFFGYMQEHVEANRFRVTTKAFAERADNQGQVIQAVDDASNRLQWIVTARTPQGRFAYLGFSHVWRADYHDQQYNEVKTFSITDRPVYRPGQTVNFKFWVRHARYDQPDTSDFAHKTFQVEIRNPKNEVALTKQLTADAYAGIEGQLELPADATLGVYSMQVVGHGGGSFRVEEYKKPEFEVTVEAPDKPVMLGEKITAKIEAKYYFGAPVTEAKVKYKVQRSQHQERWLPLGRWDWLYGRGYWWFAYDYTWYPGWSVWGCERPIPSWWPRQPLPPEIIAEAEVEIGPDGAIEVEIDTAVAKAIHPDQDHRYEIIAEVVDQSRRTIVGRGEVLVARKPFEVCVWTDRGYYRVGDTIGAHFSARTLDNQPVAGSGEATLLAITYDEKQQPIETPVGKWALNTDAEGAARLQIKASQAGQYRLKYVLKDAAGHAIEGGYLFTIIGAGFDGSEFRFNDIELIPDKKEYAPGEKIQLQVNTNRAGATVLLFARPSNGVYLPPQVLNLQGKSQIVEVGVETKDMPNIFLEAVTVHDGQVHSTTREIYVPPEKRVLGVEVVTSAEAYKPGQPAKVKVKLTDAAGKAFVGSTVLAIYDKALEYISGGSNVENIKEFFWSWKRSHYPRSESNLGDYSGNLTLPGKPGMADLGVFGATVADEVGEKKYEKAQNNDRLERATMARGMMADGLAAPMAAAAPAMEMQLADADKSGPGGGFGGATGGAAGPPLVQPTVRTNFADTALWKAAVTTNSDGLAEVELIMPENLTSWKVRAWALGHGTKVGQGEAEVVTRKDLLVRMQAPRFFVETDEVVLSANVHNYLKTAKQVTVALELDGKTLRALDPRERTIEVPENGETRVDWRVKVVREGQALVRIKALTDEESDAMEMKFPVYIHGMLKFEAVSGALRPDDASGKFTFRVPAERRPDDSRLEVRYSPTLAGAMVDALPYLADYPYGCTEQTLNRFLPTVITQNVLLRMNLDLEAIQKKRTNLNAQEIGDDRERAEGWKRFDRNPVFDKAEVDKMVKDGVSRLAEMQLSDGGWGWFSGWGEQSYAHTTAVVVHGLQVAQENDVALLPGMLDRGVAWLANYQDQQIELLKNAADKKKNRRWKAHADNLDALVHMVLVDAGVDKPEMRDFLYRDRNELAVYGKSLLGMSLWKTKDADRLEMVMQNISQYVVQDDENQTAYLKLPEGSWWYWYGSEYEAHAYYLKLLSRVDPQNPTAARMVKYLLNNRKHATYWNSTRDTALVVEAFAEYLKASGEDQPDLTVEVWLDGQKKKEVKITAADLFTFDNKFVLTGEEVATGAHTIELRKTGKGPLYYNGYLTTFTLEDFITAAGLEIKVARNYYRLKPVEKTLQDAGSRGQVVDRKVEKFEREPIVNLATVTSGDLIEVELVIESKNDYEYILLEDMKAAGFEPVEVQSGYTDNALRAYIEFRDNRVVLFARRLARGKHSVAYRVRAEIPGQFSALPTRASAMYAPELKANSDELKVKIEDAPRKPAEKEAEDEPKNKAQE